MTTAPADLLGFRATVMGLTGLGSPVEVGIVGDGAHQHTGGYHEGIDVLEEIGRYHPPATSHIGSSAEDYSARLARDRRGLTTHASAVDIGDDWPHGGRPAWLRFNNLLVGALHANDPALAAIRAVNYSPDGTATRRTDRENGWKVKTSTDSVDVHTHIEWYRDTDGHRQASFDRLAELIIQAITGEQDMAQLDNIQDTLEWVNRRVEALGRSYPTLHGDKPQAGEAMWLVEQIQAIVAQVKANGTGLTDVKAALAALTSAVDALNAKVTALAAPPLSGDVNVTGTLHITS